MLNNLINELIETQKNLLNDITYTNLRPKVEGKLSKNCLFEFTWH